MGPADDSHIQEGAARRGSAFPRSYKFPGGGVFKMRRSDEARSWDIEPSRAYIQHAIIEANDPDWEEPELLGIQYRWGDMKVSCALSERPIRNLLVPSSS